MPQIKGARRSRSSDTPRRLVDATVELLSTVGFAATTVRAIGERAGCNPALVSYHFGSADALLLAALDVSSGARLARYEAAFSTVSSWKEARKVLRGLYREDRDSGHLTLLGEMVAGGLMNRDLGRQVADRIEPWVTLVYDTLARLVPTAALRRRLPLRDIAYGITASFLGLGLLGSLTEDPARGDVVIERLTADRPVWKPNPASGEHR